MRTFFCAVIFGYALILGFVVQAQLPEGTFQSLQPRIDRLCRSFEAKQRDYRELRENPFRGERERLCSTSVNENQYTFVSDLNSAWTTLHQIEPRYHGRKAEQLRALKAEVSDVSREAIGLINTL